MTAVIAPNKDYIYIPELIQDATEVCTIFVHAYSVDAEGDPIDESRQVTVPIQSASMRNDVNAVQSYASYLGLIPSTWKVERVRFVDVESDED